VGIRCADHATPLYQLKLALTSSAGCGRLVGIVRLRTKTTDFFFFFLVLNNSAEPLQNETLYCNVFDQCIARRRLCKRGPARKNRATGLCNPFLGNAR
jgi:hypothetical protein